MTSINHRDGDNWMNRFSILIRYCLVLGSFLLSQISQADVLILALKTSSVLEDMASNLEKSLKTKVRITTSGALEKLNKDSLDTVVTLGPRSLSSWTDYSRWHSLSDVPVVPIFTTYEDVSAYPSVMSAIFIEPPLLRQIHLAQLIFGQGTGIGILIPDKSFGESHRLTKNWMDKLGVTIYAIDEFPSLAHSLATALDDNKVLVGVYDSNLYGADNLKSILIASYRRGRALIGPSKAYLKAGAVATTYSDLEDTEKRLLELLESGLVKGIWQEPNYNPYFKVGYNEQVARSLNIILPDAMDTEQSLRRME